MAVEEVRIVTCDVCKGENAEEFERIQAITIGNEYEYGISSWEERPLKDKLSFHKVDLCNNCQKELETKQLRYIMGFHRSGRYYLS